MSWECPYCGSVNGCLKMPSFVPPLIVNDAGELERLRKGIEQCYGMLLSEPDTKGALFKAENILRELLAPNA